MVLKDFALLAADTARTKAYLHAMLQRKLLPAMCIVYSEDISKMQKDAKTYLKCGVKEQYFDLQRPVLSFIQEGDIPYVLVENKDINSEEIKSAIQNLQQKYLI